LVSLSPTKMWPLLFAKVIRYPNSIKFVRCSLLKRPTLLRRRHKVLYLSWLLVIRMTHEISDHSSSNHNTNGGKRNWNRNHNGGKNCSNNGGHGGEKGVPTEGAMRVVVVRVEATTVAVVVRLAVATVTMVGSSQQFNTLQSMLQLWPWMAPRAPWAIPHCPYPSN